MDLQYLQDFQIYLQSKNLSPSTQKHYCRYVNNFLAWYKLDIINCTKKDILKYLEHLQSKLEQENITRKNTLIGLNHFFTYLLKSEIIFSNPNSLLKIRGTKRKTLYQTYSQEQLNSIFDNYYLLFIQNFDNTKMPKNTREINHLVRQRNLLVLGILIYQGINTSDLQHILIEDIDLIKASIKIKATLKSNERLLNLHASQIGVLYNYLQNIRPQFFEYCKPSEHLFITIPKNNTESENTLRSFKTLTNQIKTIDKTFLNFKQIRASVITNWIKIDGLRKAQYFAGHRFISSTEIYLSNNLDGLIDDITKFNPF
jgi:site-specific recombinase XerD